MPVRCLLLISVLGALACGSSSSQGGPASHDDSSRPDPNADSTCELRGFGKCVAAGACSGNIGYPSTAACGTDAPVCCVPLDRCSAPSSPLLCCDANGNQSSPVCDVPAGASSSPAPLACPADSKESATGDCTGGQLDCIGPGELCDPRTSPCCSGSACIPASTPADGGAPIPAHCE